MSQRELVADSLRSAKHTLGTTIPQQTQTGLLMYRYIQILVFSGCTWLRKVKFTAPIRLGAIECPLITETNTQQYERTRTQCQRIATAFCYCIKSYATEASRRDRQTLLLCFQCPLVRNTFLTGDIYRVSIIDVASPLFPLLAIVPLLCHPLSQAGSHCGDERVRVSTESESTPLQRLRRYGIME
jgi:hypothetical protein